MNDLYCTQFVSHTKDLDTAKRELAALALLDGYLCGEVLVPGPGKPSHRARAFFDDMGPDAVYPDGMRRVLLSSYVARLIYNRRAAAFQRNKTEETRAACQAAIDLLARVSGRAA